MKSTSIKNTYTENASIGNINDINIIKTLDIYL